MRNTKIALIAALSAGVFFASCGNNQEANKEQLYNNAANVDLEGFEFLKTVHEKAVFELGLARHAASVSTSADVKALTVAISETYSAVIPELEQLATDAHVILPDPGMPEFNVPAKFALDSAAGFDDQQYLHRFVHEQKLILDQFDRAEKNTYKPLNGYAKEKLAAIKELYAMAGGEEDHALH